MIGILLTLIQGPFSVRASKKYPVTGGLPTWISGCSYFTLQLVVQMSLMTGAVGGKGTAESQTDVVSNILTYHLNGDLTRRKVQPDRQ